MRTMALGDVNPLRGRRARRLLDVDVDVVTCQTLCLEVTSGAMAVSDKRISFDLDQPSSREALRHSNITDDGTSKSYGLQLAY